MASSRHSSDNTAADTAAAAEKEVTATGHRARYATVYGFFGFNRGYNFPLWIIFAGAMLGFSLSRLQYYNYNGIFAFDIDPGWWYHFRSGTNRIGMLIHLATCLPAGILVVLQFTPIIRHKALLFHRINGYVVLLLFFMGNVGAAIILRHNDSGIRVAAQTAEGFLIIISTIGISLAWWNIRRLQIDQHRAWMLRSMFYFGAIITSRIFTNTASVLVTHMGDYYAVWKCDEIDFQYKRFGIDDALQSKYPQCLMANGTTDGRVAVSAARIMGEPERVSAAISIPFGAMLWMATALHIVGVEIYLNLTPRESQRLRLVSYEKQLAAGYPHPGSAGLTSDRWGDAERYAPPSAA